MDAYQEFFRIGQYTDNEAMTGCTVILCEDGVTGGVSGRFTEHTGYRCTEIRE